MKGNKIVLIFCGLILVAFIMAKSFKDDIKVISLGNDQYQNSELEIVDGENFIKYASKINSIEAVKWINDNTVEFKGKTKGSDNFQIFQFNYNDKKLSLSNDSKKDEFYSNDFKEDIKSLQKIAEDNYLIYAQGKDKRGLFNVKKGHKPVVLAKNIKYNDKLLFKISDDKKKVAYYDIDDKTIKIYNFANNQIAKIDEEINNGVLSDFKNNISFSYEGGYLAIANINRENFKESNFSVYGADSGKRYAEKLMGINPVWGKDNLKIAFTYMENNSVVNTKEKSSYNLVGDRAGFFNLKTRKIKYAQNFGEGFKVMKPSIWKDNNRMLITVGKYNKEQNRYNFNRVYIYNIENNTLADLAGYFKNIDNIGDNFKIELSDSYLYIYSKSKDGGKSIKIMDLESRYEKEYNNVHGFTTNGEVNNEKILYKNLKPNEFLYVHNDGIYITDLKSNYLKYKTYGNVIGIYESPDKSRLFIISKYEENYELAIVNI